NGPHQHSCGPSLGEVPGRATQPIGRKGRKLKYLRCAILLDDLDLTHNANAIARFSFHQWLSIFSRNCCVRSTASTRSMPFDPDLADRQIGQDRHMREEVEELENHADMPPDCIQNVILLTDIKPAPHLVNP
ncbi:MAG: hypothetical protein WD075_15780, partial [Rhodospirillales bacterium]